MMSNGGANNPAASGLHDDFVQMRLAALSGSPFDDVPTRDFVRKCAQDLSHRQNVEVFDFRFEPDSVSFIVKGDQVIALGFATELRSATNQWYESKYRDGPLWGTHKPI